MRINFFDSINENELRQQKEEKQKQKEIQQRQKEQQRLEKQRQKEQQQLERLRQKEIKQKEREEIKYLQNHILFLIKNEKFSIESLKEIDNFIKNKREDK